MLSKKSKTIRKTEKELKSFKNKMGKDLIWFNSLDKHRQLDLLFMWKREKYQWEKTENHWFIKYDPVTKRWKRFITTKLTLKHWISKFKSTRKFTPTKSGIRNSAIDIILKNK